MTLLVAIPLESSDNRAFWWQPLLLHDLRSHLARHDYRWVLGLKRVRHVAPCNKGSGEAALLPTTCGGSSLLTSSYNCQNNMPICGCSVWIMQATSSYCYSKFIGYSIRERVESTKMLLCITRSVHRLATVSRRWTRRPGARHLKRYLEAAHGYGILRAVLPRVIFPPVGIRQNRQT